MLGMFAVTLGDKYRVDYPKDLVEKTGMRIYGPRCLGVGVLVAPNASEWLAQAILSALSL